MASGRDSVDDPDTNPASDVGHVVARIDGALGSAILVGLDRLHVSHGTGPHRAGASRQPWAYGDLEDVSISHYGTMPVVLLHLLRRVDPLPVLILERGQVGPALDGLVTLRRLIAAAGNSLASA